MENLISIMGRNIKAQGLNKSALPDRRKIKELVFSDYLPYLDNLPQLNLPSNPLLFYPGCGSDILMPLLYVEKMFPAIKEFSFLFIDINDLLQLIQTTLDEVGVSFSQDGNKIDFYWDEKLIHLEFQQGDVSKIDLPEYDLYFEQFFRIMKPEGFEEIAYNKLKSNGILISDNGFQKFPLEKKNSPQGLSPYGEMIIGIKK